MHDSIIKNTGNSRYLKSNILPGITHEELVALLRSGQFAFDFNGINELAFDQIGTPLNKSTLLSDETETSVFGNSNGDRTVSDALLRLANRAATLESMFSFGEYVGTGTSKQGSPNSLAFSRPVLLLIVSKMSTSGTADQRGSLQFVWHGQSDMFANHADNAAKNIFSAENGGKTVKWYLSMSSGTSATWADYQFNKAGTTYRYFAILA